jgi:hypothetical protein
MSENDLKQPYLEKLREYFSVQEEVIGHHFSGKSVRLDAVLRPLNVDGWKNPSVALGVEFKDVVRFSKSYDTRNLTSWLAQCVDYANTDWEGYGFIYVFACPTIIGEVSTPALGNGMFIRNFMGQMGVGELVNQPYRGLTFLLHGHHRVWSEHTGVESGRRYSLKRKVGAR